MGRVHVDLAEELLSAPPRAAERIDVAVEVTLGSEHNLMAAVTENMSVGGVFVATEHLLPSGTHVRLRLSLPDGRPITTDATVRWCRPASAPEGPGMGLQFAHLSSDDAATIAGFAAERPPMYWEPSPGPEADAAAGPRVLPREIALRYVPVIRALAIRLARRLPSHVLVDDLVGAGFVGLVDAFRHYDPAHCDRFEAFAQVRIRGAMLDELRSADPLSRSLRSLAKRAREATEGLRVRLGHAPEEAEVAQALGIPVDAFRDRMASIAAAGSTAVLDGSRSSEGDAVDVSDPSAPDASEELVRAETMRALADAVAALPPRLQQLLQLYYGDELTLRDIGSVLGVTEGRVSQLHAEALERLRSRARAKANTPRGR